MNTKNWQLLNQVINGDCLEVMQQIEDQSVDMILCDLPYGTTACKWDMVINFELLWAAYKRIIKPNGAIVLTASQPFTSVLVTSNLKMFKYCLVWDKVNKMTGALNANRMPMKRHEDIAVFYSKQPAYNKQYRQGKPYKSVITGGHGEHTDYGKISEKRFCESDGKRNPCSIVEINGDNKREAGLHPTQKPVALFEYLIKTYSNPGETILDNCLGSGTTAVAAINTDRNFIGIELDPGYCEIARQRIETAKQSKLNLE